MTMAEINKQNNIEKTNFRLFPLIIFILTIFLCNRLVMFVSSLSDTSLFFPEQVVFAEGTKNEHNKPPTSNPPSPQTTPGTKIIQSENMTQKIVQTEAFKEIKIDYNQEATPVPPEKLPIKQDYSKEEIQILEQLKKRREIIERREKTLAEQESLLQIVEKRIDGKISELNTLKTNLEKVLKSLDTEQEKQIRSLVKIYETMKPKAAAQIFNDLELNVLIEVVERMKEAKVAPILSFMNPARVTQVTSILAERKKIPRQTS